MLRRFFLLFLLLALGACANGRKVDYAHAYPEIPQAFGNTVEVQVIDERPYVLSGDKKGSFVGLTRGSYYIPYDVNTRSGAPLAKELQQSLLGGFERKGIAALAVSEQARQASSANARLLAVRVREWKSERFMGVVLTHALTIEVFDAQGQRLASVSLQGSDNVYNFTDSGKAILANALASETVRQALNGQLLEPVEAVEIDSGPVRRNAVPLFTPPVARDMVF